MALAVTTTGIRHVDARFARLHLLDDDLSIMVSKGSQQRTFATRVLVVVWAAPSLYEPIVGKQSDNKTGWQLLGSNK